MLVTCIWAYYEFKAGLLLTFDANWYHYYSTNWLGIYLVRKGL